MGCLDGERDEVGLCGEQGLIAHPVFIESGYDGISLAGYQFVQPLFYCTYPISSFGECLWILAQFIAKIEVAVTKRTLGGVDLRVQHSCTQ